ncbi:hypothetical protein [Flavobacterium nitrogenifigens]|uniref:PhoD-like phosphatase n=1 Tax=Flavobacterium nitrogenifigens TaxID=1617283 RepID=A0A521BMR6_9FLAO|nr:hypothetical protein [Flavobacterium nitrogenifigens]KAF2330878.1 hypothetical protein DM397_13880 [Flavobacterium nitrogenifigens]SMO48061.1 hypothetical protein SAMN06265220_1011109 [Flavobacterium nitrogenifigens]
MTNFTRRKFVQTVARAALLNAVAMPFLSFAAEPENETSDWDAGQLAHIIPGANHERFLIKTSFKMALQDKPYLLVNGRKVIGEKTDTEGRFWRFDVQSLNPSTVYKLRIFDSNKKPLSGEWPLKTFPAPNEEPEKLRILAYTCAGGYDSVPMEGKTFFLDMKARRKLLEKGLSFQPDAVIANGDHIYWDIQTYMDKPFAKYIEEETWKKFGGPLDISVPMMHPKNASIFLGVCDYQIAGLYGTSLRSTPVFFLTDDHDYFENDEYSSELVSLPVETYGTLGAEQTQHLYYPEFLPDSNRPEWLPGGDKAASPKGTNICFGTFRYGKLLEAVFYDCRRFVNYQGDQARILPKWVEDWIISRTKNEDTAHFMHVPSLPFAYSSGKLGDWYPDLLDMKTKKLVIYEEKIGWQRGWFAQHQRLVDALASQTKRTPLIIQGDFHATAAGKMLRSGELEFANPIHAVLCGTLGTGDIPFPSAFRNVESKPSQMVEMEQTLKPVEKNGFSIIDVTRDKITFSMYTWRPPQAIEEIDTMKPVLVYEVPRK